MNYALALKSGRMVQPTRCVKSKEPPKTKRTIEQLKWSIYHHCYHLLKCKSQKKISLGFQPYDLKFITLCDLHTGEDLYCGVSESLVSWSFVRCEKPVNDTQRKLWSIEDLNLQFEEYEETAKGIVNSILEEHHSIQQIVDYMNSTKWQKWIEISGYTLNK